MPGARVDVMVVRRKPAPCPAVIDVRFAALAPGSWRPSRTTVVRWLHRMAALETPASVELSVLLTGDGEIRRLNRVYRHIDRATDVLSFGVPRRGPCGPRPAQPLGDIVVSLESCRRQARALRVPARRRLAHLLAHGLLHLLGHEHRTVRTLAAMERRAALLVDEAFGAGAKSARATRR